MGTHPDAGSKKRNERACRRETAKKKVKMTVAIRGKEGVEVESLEKSRDNEWASKTRASCCGDRYTRTVAPDGQSKGSITCCE